MNLLSLAEQSTDSFRHDDGVSHLESLARPMDYNGSNILERDSQASGVSIPAHRPLPPATFKSDENMFAKAGAIDRHKLETMRGMMSRRSNTFGAGTLHAPHLTSSIDTLGGNLLNHSRSDVPEGSMNRSLETQQSSTSAMHRENILNNSDAGYNHAADPDTNGRSHANPLVMNRDHILNISKANLSAAMNVSRDTLTPSEAMAAGLNIGSSHSLSTTAASGSKAVLAALRALQDKVRRVETERDTALEGGRRLELKVSQYATEIDSLKDAARLEKEKLSDEHRTSIDSVEEMIRQRDERCRNLEMEIKMASEKYDVLQTKLESQMSVSKAYQDRLEEAAAEMQRVQQKEREISQTIIWESKRYEEEKLQQQAQNDELQRQLAQLQLANEQLESRNKELKLTNKALAAANSGFVEELNSIPNRKRSSSFKANKTITSSAPARATAPAPAPTEPATEITESSILSATFDDSDDSGDEDYVPRVPVLAATVSKTKNPSVTSKKAPNTRSRSNSNASVASSSSKKVATLPPKPNNNKSTAVIPTKNSSLVATRKRSVSSESVSSNTSSKSKSVAGKVTARRARANSMESITSKISEVSEESDIAELSNIENCSVTVDAAIEDVSSESAAKSAETQPVPSENVISTDDKGATDHAKTDKQDSGIAFTQIQYQSPAETSIPSPQLTARGDHTPINASYGDESQSSFSAIQSQGWRAEDIENEQKQIESSFILQQSVLERNSEALESLQEHMSSAAMLTANISHSGLAPRPSTEKPTPPPAYHNVLNPESAKERELARARRQDQAKRQLGGTFGSPNSRSAVNSALLSIPSVGLGLDKSDQETDSTSSIIENGIRRGGTLDSVIKSLEDEFSTLNKQYRSLLSACSTTIGSGRTSGSYDTEEAQKAEELVSVINKLHKKGEQLRKLRVGSPSMAMFSGGATSSYISQQSNTNLDISVSAANNFPSSISSKLHTQSSANATLGPPGVKKSTGRLPFASSPNIASSDDAPSAPKFQSPLPMGKGPQGPQPPSPFSPKDYAGFVDLRTFGRISGPTSSAATRRVLEPHDDVMDFDRQDLNATSLSGESPARAQRSYS